MKSEQESVMDINLKSMNEFMIERGWKSSLCKVCNSTFFFKPSTDEMDVLICGRHKCDNRRYSFRSYSRNKRLLTPSQINIKLREYFCSAGFGIAASKNIVNFEGQTDLIIAGVQMFDDIIHHDEIIRDDKVFVAQPCVRMQFQPQVGSQEGISTSFVNVCTEKMMSNFAEHLQSVDHWLTVLSKIGLHMNNFIIASRTSVKDWGTGKFLAGELFFSYGGLELGDATYLLIPQANRAVIPISDIGFGLERIAWAINKTDSYFDLLTPWTANVAREKLDSCRTIALLVLCGVQATNKGPGLQFRRFAKVLSEKFYGEDVYSIILYYFDYWAHFINPSQFIDRQSAIQLVRLEIERFINLRVCKMLKIPPPQHETTEQYFNRLVYTCNINIHELRKGLQICKT